VSNLGVLVHNADCDENINKIREVLANSPFRTQQERVSVPRIERYVELLKSGEDMGNIKIDGDIIVDGHHRYIASQIAGIEIRQLPGTRADFKKSLPSKPISQIDLDSVDY
jgi:filamentous hemagglutinin